jgi:hypothetical protein
MRDITTNTTSTSSAGAAGADADVLMHRSAGSEVQVQV